MKSHHAWISSKPLCKWNVHERCNLGARHRWGIETGILVEKRHGYQDEHIFYYNWNVILRANVNTFQELRGNELVVGMILRRVEPSK
jgi:hypothetical protein